MKQASITGMLSPKLKEPAKRKRGRPRGARNKPKAGGFRAVVDVDQDLSEEEEDKVAKRTKVQQVIVEVEMIEMGKKAKANCTVMGRTQS